MLPKRNRISREEISEIVKVGRRFNSPSLLLYLALNNKKESTFAFSMSKKVCPSAVDRNKRRRWGYSIISTHLNKIKPGFYCFFSFKKTPKPTNFSILEKEINELLSVAGVLI